MDTIEAILSRRSVRQYKDEPVAADDLNAMLECARQAPSAGNRQPCHLAVVTDRRLRRRIADACHNQSWMGDASAIVVGLGEPGLSERWYEVDTAIAMENLVLAATSLGYATCWVGACDEQHVKDILDVPEQMRVVVLVTVGHSDQKPQARPRRDLADFASLQRYGQRFGL
jgi:nitroreductase